MPVVDINESCAVENGEEDDTPVGLKMAKQPNVGHRQRLKQRFLKGGVDAVADYELIELLLFMGIPRRDVKPLAKDLVARFGDFAGVLSARPEQLLAVKGVGEAAVVALKLVQAASVKLSQEIILDQPVLSSWSALMDYLRAAMAHLEKEQFRLLFLDRKNRLIADEVQGEGTIDHTPVYTREVVKRALDIGASAIIMVHNHPSGDPKPSKGDIAMTRDVVAACRKLEITVHDHLIIGKSGHSSFKNLGLL